MRLRVPFRCLTILALVFVASSAWAGSVSLNFSGLLQNTTVGACSSTTYDSNCPVGPCTCQTYENFKSSGNFIGSNNTEGNGSIDFTFDHGLTVGSGEQVCTPFFASLTLPGSKDTEQIDFHGSICLPSNESSPSAKQPMAGGWAIKSSTKGHSGFGTFSGNDGWNTILLTLKFKGTGS